MADNLLHFPVPAPQPGLRSFIIYDHLPNGCVAHEALNDDSEPHIRKGEFAIVDTEDHELVHGELYLIQWQSDLVEKRPQIVRLQSRFGRYGKDSSGREIEEGYRWWMGGCKRRQLVTLSGQVTGPATRWIDGPHDDEQVQQSLIGKVMGIYQPDFRAEMRSVA